MKILSIGDIHGRDTWMFLTHGSPYEYNIWKTAVEEGAPIDWDENLPFLQYDKIIFVGDYVDSFNVSNVRILHNLKEIIYFVKALGDKAEALLGNHDISYIVPNQACSGYRPEMKPDLFKIFDENRDLFKMAHQEKDQEGKIWLWTHAGVTNEWHKEFTKEALGPVHSRFRSIINWFSKKI